MFQTLQNNILSEFNVNIVVSTNQKTENEKDFDTVIQCTKP